MNPQTDIETKQEIKLVIQACASTIIDVVLDLLQRDPHAWSERPCETCRTIGSLAGREFGCYVFAEQRAAARLHRCVICRQPKGQFHVDTCSAGIGKVL